MYRTLQWTWMACVVGLGITASGCTPGDDGGATGDTGVDEPELLGAPDLTVEDVFTQTTFPAVNIVWVLDPTWDPVFREHRDIMGVFYEQLLVHGVPWKVGLMFPVTEPPEAWGQLYNTHSAVASLDSMGQLYAVSTPEQQSRFRAGVRFLMEDRYLEDEDIQEFFFAGGHLSIISFDDSADETPPGFVGRQEFLNFLDEQNVVSSVSISAITVGNATPDEADIRQEWIDYANATGGVVTSSANPALNLERVVNASLGLTKTWTLSELPAVAPQSIVSTYRGNQQRLFIGEDYTYTTARDADDAIVPTITLLGPAPLAGTRITVRYERRIEGPTGPAEAQRDDEDTSNGGGTP